VPPPLLSRRLGLRDATVIGVGSMVGAGIFTAVGPAAAAAGWWLLAGLLLAGVVATCNAMSSAWLAAQYPESGGTYVYGRERLGPGWGFTAGWAFVIGKVASCAAMALAIGAYLWPAQATAVAVGAVVALGAVNYFGIQRTAQATWIILAVVLAGLAATVVALAWDGGATSLAAPSPGSPWGIAQAAGFFFFAFAGYARIATLGEEVRDPARTIPRAIVTALAIVAVLYLVVTGVAVWSAGPALLASSPDPLATAVGAGNLAALEPIVRATAVLASAGVLLALIAGISRTALAMGRHGDAPGWLQAVHPRHGVPHRAEVAVTVLVVVVVLLGGLTAAIAVSSFAVLSYYAIANLAALTLPRGHSRGSRLLPALGLVGCVGLAIALPVRQVAIGALLVGAAVVVFLVRRFVTMRPRGGRRR
jgi:APA family basic amino acid/polyamine antiporter